MDGGNADDIDPDRLEKTPNSFLEKPLLLDCVGDIRVVLGWADSDVVADTAVVDVNDDVAVIAAVFVELLAEFSRRTSI